jgi:hypothetical protein
MDVKMDTKNDVSDLHVFRLCTSIGCSHHIFAID